MRYLILTISLLMCACSLKSQTKDLHSAAPDYTQSPSLVVQYEYETDEYIFDFKTADYPGNSATTVVIKSHGNCGGRVMMYEDGSFTLFDFAGADCGSLNGNYSYSITSQCQGYAQIWYRCGDTSLFDIVVEEF